MKLLVVSHTPHVLLTDRFLGWGPTVREINFLSEYFSITHIAPVTEVDQAPASYAEVNGLVRMVPTRNRGGRGLRAKFRVLADSFQYLRLVLTEVSRCDIVHVRCPANISLIALLVLFFNPQKRKWIKYAGDWRPLNDYWSYRIQRWLMRYALRNQLVTINGRYENEKDFIHHVLNPSYYRREMTRESLIKPPIINRVILLFVGSLTANKGVNVVLDVVSLLTLRGLPVVLHVIGDGILRDPLADKVKVLGLTGAVHFEGWKGKEQLKSMYSAAHFILLPSQGEGWPKVISEAMSFGVIPIVSDVSGIKQVLSQMRVGTVVPTFQPRDYADAIASYLIDLGRYRTESLAAFEAAAAFTFEAWISNLSRLFESHWGERYRLEPKA